jgi:hypothetical protein
MVCRDVMSDKHEQMLAFAKSNQTGPKNWGLGQVDSSRRFIRNQSLGGGFALGGRQINKIDDHEGTAADRIN